MSDQAPTPDTGSQEKVSAYRKMFTDHCKRNREKVEQMFEKVDEYIAKTASLEEEEVSKDEFEKALVFTSAPAPSSLLQTQTGEVDKSAGPATRKVYNGIPLAVWQIFMDDITELILGAMR